MCVSTLSKGDPNFENFKRGVGPEKNLGWGNQRGERFSKKKRRKKKGGTQLFKLNIGAVKNKNEDF